MSRRAAATPGERVVYYDWSRWLPALTSAAFVLCLALVTVRATGPDFLREAFDAAPGAEAAPQVGLPDRTLWLDALCCVPALLVLLRRGLDRGYVVRFTWAHGLIFALAGWAALSTAWSADRYAAAVYAAHAISAGVVCWTATQLVRSCQRLRFVAAGLAGVLAIVAVQGIYYRLAELPDTQRLVEREKDRILAERGWTEDSFAWKQFRRKVMVGEQVSFYTSPNTTAAVIVMLGLATAALATQRLRDRDEPLWPVLLLLILPAALYVLWHTNSRSAVVTLAFGAALAWAGWRFGGTMANRRAAWFAGACGLVVVATAAVVGHGLYHGTLFHDSLTFRWRYWVGSARVFEENALFGVGYGNFGYSYLAHRLPMAAEEIKDPHNLFVRGFVELGAMGGALLIGLVLRLAWDLTRPIIPPAPSGAAARPADRAAVAMIFAVAGLSGVLAAIFTIDFSRDGGYVATELLRKLLNAGLLVLIYAAGTVRGATQVYLDDRPAPLLLVGLIAALAAFLLHNLIDFSFFEPGPMHLAALLTGALLGVRGTSVAGRRKWNRAMVAAPAVALAAWLAGVLAFVMPMSDAENRAQRADDALRRGAANEAASGYKAAFENAPVRNADYAFRAGRALAMGSSDPAQAELWISQAIAANPRDAGLRAARAAFVLARPPDQQDRRQVRADYDAALGLDPQNLRARVAYADVLASWDDRAGAVEQYRLAIKTNEGLHPDEPERLSPAELERIRSRLTALGGR